jgi:ribonuclease HI
MAKQKYYVVWQGRKTGIFTDWPTTQASVAGFSGASHKSFLTRAEAEAAYKERPVQTNKPSVTTAKIKASSASEPSSPYSLNPAFDVHIFCDGGCDPNPGKSGSGVAVYQSGKLVKLYHGLHATLGTNNTAELNALHQAMLIAAEKLKEKKKVQILSDSTYSIKAMTQWGANWKKTGRMDGKGKPLANAALIKKMFDLYSLIGKEIDITHVSAHIGIEGNELADRLSTLAIRGKVTTFVEYDNLNVSQLLAI